VLAALTTLLNIVDTVSIRLGLIGLSVNLSDIFSPR
jgi:hypothetical protein